MNKKMKSYMMLGLIVSAVSVGGSVPVFAATNNDVQKDTLNVMKVKMDVRQNKNKDTHKMNFDKLVEEGIINQEVADKMTAYLEANGEQRQVEMEKIKDMTAEERKAYMEEHKGEERKDMFEEMVLEGILTREQASTIKEAMPQPTRGEHKELRGRKMNFDKLVEEGVIDQKVADGMTAFLETKEGQRQTEMEKMKDMTAEERKAYMEEHKDGMRTDMFTDMIVEGVLTDQQASTIKEAMPRPMKEQKNLNK